MTSIILQYGPLDSLQQLFTTPVSRTSPQLGDGVLYLGTQAHALLIALDQAIGSFLGLTQVNPHPLAIITMSPTYYDGLLFIGASSEEESAATIPSYNCCSFAGNFAAFRFDAGSKKFETVWNRTLLPWPNAPGG